VVWIRDCQAERILENRGSLVERDLVLLEVPGSLLRVPLELHLGSLALPSGEFNQRRKEPEKEGTSCSLLPD
jgi:hypothetical protein